MQRAVSSEWQESVLVRWLSEVATVVLMAVGLSFLATIFPSWQASKLDPVEALRYE